MIEPDWPAPANVLALCTTRAGGFSAAPWDTLNLALHVGDQPASVRANRECLQDHLPPATDIQWLSQVHGTAVVEACRGVPQPEADAVWSRLPGKACAVMTADCLPLLLCSERGDVVAAAHAGWRGLCDGVLEATVDAMGEAPGDLLAWLGPAIGPQAFEVGPEVREGFLAALQHAPEVARCFVPSAGSPGHYLADIYGLARYRLQRLGVSHVYGGGYCTFGDSERFFSYRRDGTTGRMAALILILPG